MNKPFILGLCIICMIALLTLSGCDCNHNEYWKERFKDNDCERLCESNDMDCIGEAPSFCVCELKSITLDVYQIQVGNRTQNITRYFTTKFKRQYTYRDDIQLICEAFERK